MENEDFDKQLSQFNVLHEENRTIVQKVTDIWTFRPYWARPIHRFSSKVWDKFGIPPKPKYFVQRAKSGYSVADTWNFDSFLIDVLVGGITELKSNKIGCPLSIYDENGVDIGKDIPPMGGETEFQLQLKLWDSTLDQILQGLQASKIISDSDYFYDKETDTILPPEEITRIHDELVSKHMKAWKLLGYNFFSLWD